MSTKEQLYFEMLERTDHPVFARDIVDVSTIGPDSDFNTIMNLVIARQLVRLDAALRSVQENTFPQTCNADGIDSWEKTYFNFTKPQFDLDTRKAQLLIKINKRFTMTVGDVIAAAQAIVGSTPTVIRNLYFGGWTLDVSILDVNTIFGGATQALDSETYLVIFNSPVDSDLLKKLDKELTNIEKAGSVHYVIAPPNFWLLDANALDIDTLLE